MEDYSSPFQYDAVVTLIDDAKITKDGAVVGGNKIKIGLPIVLEGFNYRLGGTISNVQILEDEDVKTINSFVEKQKEFNRQEDEKHKNAKKVYVTEPSKTK